MGVNEIIQIGSKMKAKRKEAGYTQKRMAEILGIPYTTYSNYENNNREPTYQIVERFCQELKIDINELLSVLRTDQSLRNVTTITLSLEDMLPDITKEMIINDLFNRLNDAGKDKAIKQIELLTKIPEYHRDYTEG